MLFNKFNNFEEINKYFEILNKDESHFVNSNDICTPLECVKEMVDTLPDRFWKRKNLKILDNCCGNGNFHAYIVLKTNIKNLHFNDINEVRINHIKKYFGNELNLTTKDFLSFSETEEYDLIVSNPPYAKFNNGVRVSKNHNLARSFIEKSLKITKKGGYILFIVPNNWMSFSDRNNLPNLMSKYQFIHIDIHGAKKWFPKVGSSFTWFLLKKEENKKEVSISNNYIIKDKQYVKFDKDNDFIPLYYSTIVKSIIDKVIKAKYEKYNVQTSSYLHRYTKKELIQNDKDEEFKYKLIHTPTQTVWSTIPHKYQSKYKIFISLTNQYQTFIDKCGMTQSIAFIECKNKQEAIQIKKELDSPVYKFVNNITRYGNFNNTRVIQNFNKLKYISLTEQEIEIITNFNAHYYGKRKK